MPILNAFTPNDQNNMVDKRTGKYPQSPKKVKENLISSSEFAITQNCQKQVRNLNKCIVNVGRIGCHYYENYLNRFCHKN